MSHSTLSSALVSVNCPEGFGPVVVSIPHAGRYYPQEILGSARVNQIDLERLEDRWSDALAVGMAQAGASLVTAHFARAAADCNRGELQMAPTEMAEAYRHRAWQIGPKERAGLGIVPTRLAGKGPLWRRPIDEAEWLRRIETYHRPYHQALERALAAARLQHGFAILIDLHSMPSIAAGYVGHGCDVIVGDRFGASSGGWLAELALDGCGEGGFVAGLNRPYAGGYILERHAKPAQNIFGVQLEFDRSLYLQADRSLYPEGAARVATWLAVFAQRAAEVGKSVTEWGVAAE